MATMDGAVPAPVEGTNAQGKKGSRRSKAVKRLRVNQGSGSDGTGLKRKHKGKNSQQCYNIYISKVLKDFHPKFHVSSKAMSVMNSFVVDFFEKIASQAGSLAKYNKKVTIGSREIETAVKLLLPPDLAKFAMQAGIEALKKSGLLTCH